ncbi:MAG: hypothetical protein QOC82_506 [Frankiaceae bacterium]|jgi:hypothetical protein|nr:hypothetical protein [Frankiaceae bacterium]
MEQNQIIRPAAVLPEEAAIRILDALRAEDVSCGGTWNATSALWQRYDQPWDALTGLRGDAQLLGTICVAYDTPTRFSITVYRVTITAAGMAAGWSVARLCDDAFSYGGLTLESCPRAELRAPARSDPFRQLRTELPPQQSARNDVPSIASARPSGSFGLSP